MFSRLDNLCREQYLNSRHQSRLANSSRSQRQKEKKMILEKKRNLEQTGEAEGVDERQMNRMAEYSGNRAFATEPRP